MEQSLAVLDALCETVPAIQPTSDALRAALAEPVGEPVAWISEAGMKELKDTGRTEVFAHKDYECLGTLPFYTAPQPPAPAVECDCEELVAALKKLLCATEFVSPNLDIMTGTDAIACQRELYSARSAAEAALAIAAYEASTPAAPAVELTDEEIEVIDDGMCGHREFSVQFARAAIAAHEQKRSKT
jgi:hypothetical protein